MMTISVYIHTFPTPQKSCFSRIDQFHTASSKWLRQKSRGFNKITPLSRLDCWFQRGKAGETEASENKTHFPFSNLRVLVYTEPPKLQSVTEKKKSETKRIIKGECMPCADMNHVDAAKKDAAALGLKHTICRLKVSEPRKGKRRGKHARQCEPTIRVHQRRKREEKPRPATLLIFHITIAATLTAAAR